MFNRQVPELPDRCSSTVLVEALDKDEFVHFESFASTGDANVERLTSFDTVDQEAMTIMIFVFQRNGQASLGMILICLHLVFRSICLRNPFLSCLKQSESVCWAASEGVVEL